MSQPKQKNKGFIFGKDEETIVEGTGIKNVSYKHNTFIENCPVDEETVEKVMTFSKDYSEQAIDLATKKAVKYFEEEEDSKELTVTYPMHTKDTLKVTVQREKDIDGEVAPRIMTELKVSAYDHREYIVNREKKLADIMADI